MNQFVLNFARSFYKNEKLSVEEKTFLEGFLEGVLENNAGLDKFKDFKNEIENAIKNEV